MIVLCLCSFNLSYNNVCAGQCVYNFLKECTCCLCCYFGICVFGKILLNYTCDWLVCFLLSRGICPWAVYFCDRNERAPITLFGIVISVLYVLVITVHLLFKNNDGHFTSILKIKKSYWSQFIGQFSYSILTGHSVTFSQMYRAARSFVNFLYFFINVT